MKGVCSLAGSIGTSTTRITCLPHTGRVAVPSYVSPFNRDSLTKVIESRADLTSTTFVFRHRIFPIANSTGLSFPTC